MLNHVRQWAHAIKRDIAAIYVAARDPRTPWYAKATALVVAGYALSPIDLVPDFIPVLGYLDDLVLLPLGIALVVWMIPADLMTEYRAKAERLQAKPVSRTAGIIIAIIWAVAIIAVAWAVVALLQGVPAEVQT
jgi:uncharacterized membrane protein YkvA (DUF1232 family)